MHALPQVSGVLSRDPEHFCKDDAAATWSLVYASPLRAHIACVQRRSTSSYFFIELSGGGRCADLKLCLPGRWAPRSPGRGERGDLSSRQQLLPLQGRQQLLPLQGRQQVRALCWKLLEHALLWLCRLGSHVANVRLAHTSAPRRNERSWPRMHVLHLNP